MGHSGGSRHIGPQAEGGGNTRRPFPGDVPIDLYRAIVFPNRLRELRREHGFVKLLHFASVTTSIPYIRLSKIERGEVVARPEELRVIGAALEIDPLDLLLDLGADDFDIARWAEPFRDSNSADLEEERFAVLLGAAVRERRTSDPALSIAAIDRDFGLPPVNLSRVENAHKPWDRWNAATQGALLSLFDVPDAGALRAYVASRHVSGTLDGFIAGIADPAARLERTRARIAELRDALRSSPSQSSIVAFAAPARGAAEGARPPVGLLPVLGRPLPGGLIQPSPIGGEIEAPRDTSPRAFALKVCRATLGSGLPAGSVVVVDPERYPAPGGLVAVRQDAAWRLLAVGSARDGSMTGYAMHPEHEVNLDALDPGDLAAVVAAVFP